MFNNISHGVVDFMIGLVNCVFNLPGWQVKLFREFRLQKNGNQSHSLKNGACQNGFQASAC